MQEKKVIIVSAVNLVEAGPLAILQGCLQCLSATLADQYRVIALVNRKELVHFERIEYLEFPLSKKSWLNRLYYEYWHFRSVAVKFKPCLWLSLHDMTPNVTAKRLAVYCHNASPFYKISLKEAVMDPKFALFTFFYKYLYQINRKRRHFVIVQQDWVRKRFKDLDGSAKIIVAHPKIDFEKKDRAFAAQENVFFYPSLPRVFKNFEVIIKASEKLIDRGVSDFQVIFTISGDENPYARYVKSICKHIEQIRFVGLQSRDKINELYGVSSCLVFPSKLETWGLPITEFQHYHKPMLLSDLPFAREAAGTYGQAVFFDPGDAKQLADLMQDFLGKRLAFKPPRSRIPEQPFAENWEQLFDILLKADAQGTCAEVEAQV